MDSKLKFLNSDAIDNSKERIKSQCNYLKDEIDVRIESLRIKLDELRERYIYNFNFFIIQWTHRAAYLYVDPYAGNTHMHFLKNKLRPPYN
jgi:hypothetical protein